jgi:hypothetical protein
MQSVKKSLLVLLAAMAVSVLAQAPAQAQTACISVDVPFDFVLGNHLMKADRYRIQTQGNFLAVVNSAGQTRYVLMFPDGTAPSRNGQPYLRFHRYGNESFLTTVVFSEKDTVRLPRTSREKEITAQNKAGEPVDLGTAAAR